MGLDVYGFSDWWFWVVFCFLMCSMPIICGATTKRLGKSHQVNHLRTMASTHWINVCQWVQASQEQVEYKEL